MKKIFTLLVTMCTALCAFAEDLTFSVAIEGNIVTVTPSADDQLYFCAALDEATINLFKEVAQEQDIDYTSPLNLFLVASGLNTENLFTGETKLTCVDGNNTLVMCAAEKTEEGAISPLGEITVMPITINGGNENPDLDPLTFTFECDNDGFTVTPSDDVQEYVASVIPQTELDAMLGMMNMTVDEAMKMMGNYGQLYPFVNKGTSHHTLEEYAEEGDQTGDGLYIVLVAGVQEVEGTYHAITTPVYQYEWLIDHSTTGISDVEAATVVSKLFKDGKFIINGRVNLDGTLAR